MAQPDPACHQGKLVTMVYFQEYIGVPRSVLILVIIQ